MMTNPARRGWHRLMGPVDRPQSLTVLAAATAAGTVVALRTARRRARWLPAVVVGAVAVDLVGGLIAFRLEPVRRKYAAAGTLGRLAFPVVHVQPYALPLVGEGTWRRAAARHAAAIVATAVLQAAEQPPVMRRVTADGIATAVALLDVAIADGPQRWFGPVYAYKVIGGHGSLVGGR